MNLSQQPPTETCHAIFPIGCLVRPSALGRLASPSLRPITQTGIVTGYGRRENLIRVRLAHRRRSETWHVACWERA